MFGDIEDDTDFLAGYRDAGGSFEFTPNSRLRLNFYKIYLYLIMIIENVPRGVKGPKAFAIQRYVTGKLKHALKQIF